MTVTPRDDREGQSQLPVTMTPALKALLRAVADGKVGKNGGVLPVHNFLRRVRVCSLDMPNGY